MFEYAAQKTAVPWPSFPAQEQISLLQAGPAAFLRRAARRPEASEKAGTRLLGIDRAARESVHAAASRFGKAILTGQAARPLSFRAHAG